MRTLRLLCLHGYHGSGEILRRQLQPLVRDLPVPLDLCYVDAPSLADGDFGWWHQNFRGWERTRDWAADLFAQQPRFDGIFGFSQGAALTALLTGLRAPDGQSSPERPLSFDFAMMASGFRTDSPRHAELFTRRESFMLPSFHMLSRADPIVATADSRALAAQFSAPVVVEHDGGHVIASTPPVRAAFTQFLTEMATRPQSPAHTLHMGVTKS